MLTFASAVGFGTNIGTGTGDAVWKCLFCRNQFGSSSPNRDDRDRKYSVSSSSSESDADISMSCFIYSQEKKYS